jgi:chromosome segregation protein
MLLTKLEIKGFKSFGDKITIHFDEGVTGIVGQNGCGKSNVVDAIRWVLGEQKTKALRSDKMENIIFNGTRKRKPLNMAEVSLTFKNTKNIIATEYSEVTITRRLYRSGESEYLLNGVACRLKDITNLFLDTGIGSDSYAIIELKMVDEILNDKENSRRNLFEEAAGISKFKIRKKETLKKLDDATQDLARVEDVLFEIEKELKKTERQARQAEKYFKLKEEYKQASIELAKISIEQRRDTFLKINEQLKAESDQKLSLNTQLSEKEALIEKEKTEQLIKEKTLQSRQRQFNEFFGQIKQYEGEKKIKNERLKMLAEKQETLSEQIKQDQERLQEAQHQISKLELERTSADKQKKDAWLELETLRLEQEQQKTETSGFQEKANVLNRNFSQKQQEYFNLTKAQEIKQSQLSGLKQTLERVTSDDFQRTENLALYEDQLSEAYEALQSSKTDLENLQIQENDTQNEIQDIQSEIETLKEQISGYNRQLDSKQNEYNLTKSLVDNLEGFPEAIKYLKKHPEFAQDAPLLSDILACEEKYRSTLEGYLEPLMNYYVVENEKDALKAINLLSDASKGKANFFVLESFKNFQPSTSKNIAQTVFAYNIAEFSEKYQKLFQYILDKVYISDNEKFENIDCQEGEIVLAISGKITKRKYAISGGSVGVFEGKRIGRAKNLEVLQIDIQGFKEQISEIKEQLENKQAELQDLKENTQKETIKQVQKELNRINEQYISLRTKTEQLRNLIENSATQKNEIEQKLLELQEDLADISPMLVVKKEELEEQKLELEDLNGIVATANEKLAQKFGAFNQQNLRYHQQENRVASIEQEIKFNESALDNLQNRIQRNTDEAENTKNTIENLNELADNEDDKLIEMYRQKESMEKGVNEAEKDYYASRGEIDKLEKEQREIQRRRELADGLLNQLQNQLSETKLSLTSIKERLSVEFNIDLEILMQQQQLEDIQNSENVGQAKSTYPEADLQQIVEKLKREIEGIGAINPMAMETYNEIKLRYDFITTQRQDILNSKNSLMQTIDEIDQVAKENFMKTFSQIRENFQTVFRSLFTEEDTCDLILVNPDNCLESAIDIIAKPKGKRPLTINQLSGGEKTLTATSLLFAIYLIKPAPFCIFDEVDAPLDDANVDKFNNIIRKFSTQSQFIIVTHNKRTMTATDIMYGVTMFPEDPGVSKLVPVDLRSLAEAVN